MRRTVLSAAYHPLRAANAVARAVREEKGNQLRVLLFHDVPAVERPALAAQLRWLARTWRFVSPHEFSELVAGKSNISGRNLLLSFDDGFASNRAVAEDVLAPMRISALFFVVPGFVECRGLAEAQRFIASRIRPGTSPAELGEETTNLTWPDLNALVRQGHTIGAHTATHARLSTLAGSQELTREIVASADAIEQRLGHAVDHFAFPFGDIASMSMAAMAVARKRFRFVHSGVRGGNGKGTPPAAIRRDAVTPSDPHSLLGALTEGAADFLYARPRRILDGWAAK